MTSTDRLLLLACGFAFTLLAAEAPRTVRFGIDNSGKPIPRFSNGYTLFVEREPATILAYSADGAPPLRSVLESREYSHVTIADACARQDGSIAVSASAVTGDPGPSPRTALLFDIAPNGRVLRVTRTSPTGTGRLVCAPDGNVWLLARLLEEAAPDGSARGLLTVYNREGKQVRSHLPSRDFPIGKSPIHGYPILAANADRLSIYSSATHEYLELNWEGRLLGKWQLPPIAPGGAKPVSGALTNSGELYLSATTSSASISRTDTFRLDRAENRFVRVDTPAGADRSQAEIVFGAAGGDLVFYTRPAGLLFVAMP